MGGGVSSPSKAVIVAPSTRDGVDYSFAQIVVDKPVVDYAANCGNLASAVGPYAVDQGLADRADGPATLRIHNTKTDKVIEAHFEVRDGCARVDQLSIEGVEFAVSLVDATNPVVFIAAAI